MGVLYDLGMCNTGNRVGISLTVEYMLSINS